MSIKVKLLSCDYFQALSVSSPSLSHPRFLFFLYSISFNFSADDINEIWCYTHCKKNWRSKWQVSISYMMSHHEIVILVFWRVINILCFLLCSVFDVDDDTIPSQFRNGFTFLNADEQVCQWNMKSRYQNPICHRLCLLSYR